MYKREILDPRPSLVENGIPVQGTWNQAFDEVDLLEIRKPYLHPLPRWLRDCRLKEWVSFKVQDDRIVLDALLGNVKLFRLAQVSLYDKETGELFVSRKIMPGSGWKLPQNLANASVSTRSKRFFFSVHSWLDADAITLDLNLRETLLRPSLTAHLAYNMNRQDTTPMAVSLPFTERRFMYAFKALAAVRGDMVFDGRHTSLKPDTCSGFFCDYKGFFPYPMREQVCSAAGFDAEGQRFGFHIAENQTRETFKNNENALWVNGELTPLPPVRITMPKGPESDWIIQDLEGMVDLVFTPQVPNRSGATVLVTSVDFDAPLGYYNGMVASDSGAKIQVRNLFGMGEKLFLQV